MISEFFQAADPPTATLHSPPASTHFAESQKLRNPATAASASRAAAPVLAEPAPAVPPVTLPYTMPYGYPPPFPYPYPQSFPYPPYPQYPPMFAPPRADGGPGSAPTSPTKIVLPRTISLAEFCDRYEIDDEDHGCLSKLKFQPGDRRVDKLEREDWHGHAGFSKLSWDDFLSKHRQFIRDVKAGNWV